MPNTPTMRRRFLQRWTSPVSRLPVVGRIELRLSGATFQANTMVELTVHSIDTAAVLRKVQSTAAGAVVLFLGTTREMTGGRGTESLDYECYPEMANRNLLELETEARRRWPIIECSLVHRLGHLLPGEVSVAVAVSTPHRDDAFAAGR